MRNEDIFILRWGQPDFVREFVGRQAGKDYVGGAIIGSECYIPALDYITKEGPHKTWRWAFERQWLFYAVWGHLLYDPAAPDARFEAMFDARFGRGVGKDFLAAWKLASRVPLHFASFHRGTWDGTLYTEGFSSWIDKDDGARTFFSTDAFIKHPVLDTKRYVNIADFVKTGHVPAGAYSPLDLADQLDRDRAVAMTLVARVRQPATVSPSREVEITDIEAWCGGAGEGARALEAPGRARGEVQPAARALELEGTVLVGLTDAGRGEGHRARQGAAFSTHFDPMSTSRAAWLTAAGLFVGLTFDARAQVGSPTGAERVQLASKPPLGWNSFDSYGVYLHEKAAMENLEAMALRLQPYGYEYFVVDNGWFGEYKLKPGTLYPLEKHASDVRLNDYGHVIPSKAYFPRGLEPIVERCHQLGLKFGIHMMRGIPRKAYEMNLPIKGTSYRARDVADTHPKNQCKWCTYNYGVDMSRPGAQEWYDGLMQHLADMGVDLVKYDDIVPSPAEVEAVAKALKKTGRPILPSLSPGGDVPPDAIKSFQMAHMLRVTRDVWDHARSLDECFDAWRRWTGKESEGFWIDMDMIPFGQLLMMSPRKELQAEGGASAVRLAGHGYRRWSQFSPDQMLTFITLRALSASPLMAGGDLPTLDGFSLRLLTDPDMLACNQNGVMGKLLSARDGIEVWKTPEKGPSDRGWVGVFNRSDRLTTVPLTPALLGLESGAKLFDIWKGRKEHELTAAAAVEIDVNPGGVLFLRYEQDRTGSR